MRKELTKKEKDIWLQLKHLLENEVCKWTEWRGLAKINFSDEYEIFQTKAAADNTDKFSLNNHISSTYILTYTNPDVLRPDLPTEPYVEIHPFIWRMNACSKRLEFESEVGYSTGIIRKLTDPNLLDWVRTELKKLATKFDSACKFIESYEDQYRQWEEMHKQINIFYNKIQKNIAAELRANGDFQ